MKPDERRPRWPQPGIALAVLAVLAAASPSHARSGAFVRDTTYRSVSDFGPDTLLVRELEFGEPMVSAVVDASKGVVVVAFPDHRASSNSISASVTDLKRLVAYDFEGRRVLWEKSTGLTPIDARANRAFLSQGTRLEVVRVDDGKNLWDIDGTPFAWEDSVAVRITDDRIVRWDLVDGFDIWSAERGTRGTVDHIIRKGSAAYIVADGIQKLDLFKGGGWSYSVPASRSGLFDVGDGGIGHVRSLYGGSRATNLTALPLFDGADVYFAADTTVVKLASGSGTVRWTQHLTRQRGFSLKQRALGLPPGEEFLGRLVLRDAGSDVAVASLGWASGPKSLLKADPPTVALLAKDDGSLRARVQVPGATFLSDMRCTPVGCYLLAADRVVLMDDSLVVRATYRAPIDLQPLGRFIDTRGAIILTTNPGIVALAPDSLTLVWSRRCGRTLALQSGANESASRYVVTTQGLIRLDQGDELRPKAYYPLRGSWAELRDGWLLLGAGTKLRVVTLLEQGPPRRPDYD